MKSALGEDPLGLMMILPFVGIAQVGGKPAFLTGHEVVLGAILVIPHHDLSRAARMGLMLRNLE